MPDANEILAQWETVCEATFGPVAFGMRPDGTMWMSIGDPLTRSHVQADWEFGQRNAAALKAGIEKMPRVIKALRVLMQFAEHEDSLWGDPNNPAAQARAKANAILEGRDALHDVTKGITEHGK